MPLLFRNLVKWRFPPWLNTLFTITFRYSSELEREDDVPDLTEDADEPPFDVPALFPVKHEVPLDPMQ